MKLGIIWDFGYGNITVGCCLLLVLKLHYSDGIKFYKLIRQLLLSYCPLPASSAYP